MGINACTHHVSKKVFLTYILNIVVISARFTNNMNSIIMLNNFEIFYEYKNKMNSTKSNETLKIKSSKSKYVKLKSNKTYFLRKKLYSQI